MDPEQPRRILSELTFTDWREVCRVALNMISPDDP
jgi:hypothetical protein